jgi:hypothetical protein
MRRHMLIHPYADRIVQNRAIIAGLITATIKTACGFQWQYRNQYRRLNRSPPNNFFSSYATPNNKTANNG